MEKKLRVLIICHGHPAFRKGGGEIAAYNLFKNLKNRDNCEPFFLAQNYEQKEGHGGTPFSVYNSDGSEILFCSPGESYEHFIFSQKHTRLIWYDFRYLLEHLKPDIVHLHHYLHLGIELIKEIRKYSEQIPLVLTLHEYLAICYRSGQMIKTTNDQLCTQASPLDCHQCFPEIPSVNFKMRELYIKSFFNLVDMFISPSLFLIERYVTWGIPREKMIYIPNGQPQMKVAPLRQLSTSEGRSKFGYFGQLNHYKGILLLLRSILKLPPEIRKTITLNIHGSSLEFQGEEFRNQFTQLLNLTQDCVKFWGSYQSDELPALMEKVDWIIVPSIWWENSPLVIQEAFLHQRPVICSNIGGMAEKVKPNQSGLHFQVNDEVDLAKCITRAATEPGLWNKLSKGITPPITVDEAADQTLALYYRLQKKYPSEFQLKVI